MIELRTQPRVNRVTLFTGCGKAGRNVARRRGALIVLGMAGVALERQTLELPGTGAFMAGIAFQGSMTSHQRKPVLVILYRLLGYRPGLDVVAPLAIRSHLAAMDVGVAIRASSAGVRKDRLDVATRAGHAFVRTLQGITRTAMVEFWDRPNGLPAH